MKSKIIDYIILGIEILLVGLSIFCGTFALKIATIVSAFTTIVFIVTLHTKVDDDEAKYLISFFLLARILLVPYISFVLTKAFYKPMNFVVLISFVITTLWWIYNLYKKENNLEVNSKIHSVKLVISTIILIIPIVYLFVWGISFFPFTSNLAFSIPFILSTICTILSVIFSYNTKTKKYCVTFYLSTIFLSIIILNILYLCLGNVGSIASESLFYLATPFILIVLSLNTSPSIKEESKQA